MLFYSLAPPPIRLSIIRECSHLKGLFYSPFRGGEPDLPFDCLKHTRGPVIVRNGWW